jgi:sugar phosphate permease
LRFRWVILAAGTFAQASYAALLLGLVVIAPALRQEYRISLTEVGVALAAPTIGAVVTLYAWGRATDAIGERWVIGAGLATAGACVAAAAYAGSFALFVVFLALAGGLGASVNSASGRAVMHWFDASGRGLALGVRQTAVPLAGVLVAIVLPAVSSGGHPRRALLAIAAGLLLGALVGLAVLREHPDPPVEPASAAGGPLRDRGIWLLSGASGFLLAPQACLVGFLVLFLREHRHVSTAAAAAVLAVLNALGIGTRIAAGRWSDLAGSRILPLRRIALLSVGLVACCAALVSGPLALLVPALVLMGCVTISWNGVSFAAVAEAAGHARSGTAIGIQQTVLAVSGGTLPVAFGALVGATSWRIAFAVTALFPLAGWRLLDRAPAARLAR